MDSTEIILKGCYHIKPRVFADDRGVFFESFNEQQFQKQTGLTTRFIQDNQSVSKRGVLRGMHFQQGKYAQAKLVRVIRGSVQDVVVDLRKDSSTFGQTFSIVLSSENNEQLFIPRGFAHGFLALEDQTIFAYKCDNYYNKDSESGIIYDDVDLKIDWMLTENELILSEKDKELLPLSECFLD